MLRWGQEKPPVYYEYEIAVFLVCGSAWEPTALAVDSRLRRDDETRASVPDSNYHVTVGLISLEVSAVIRDGFKTEGGEVVNLGRTTSKKRGISSSGRECTIELEGSAIAAVNRGIG